MNLSEFYDHVVLRDLLEYTAPGSVVIAGMASALDIANFALGYDLRVAHFVIAHPWHSLVGFLFFGYVVGHILTGVHVLIFRECKLFGWLKEDDTPLITSTFDGTPWFVSRVADEIGKHLRIPPAEAENLLLNDKKSAPVIRELVRGLVQVRLPDLYSEYVNRHSILSRFCQNMAIGIAIVLLALIAALGALISIRCLSHVFGRVDWLVLVIVVILIFDGLISIVALWQRSRRLRRTMMKHTFELLCLEYPGGTKPTLSELS